MERLKDARTIAAKRGVRSAAVTTDRRLIIAAIALLEIVTDSHNTKFTLRSTMKRKSKILMGSAIVFAALLVALFLARKQFVGGPGSPTVEGSRAVTDGGIKIPGWNGRVDAAEERAGMTLDAVRLVGERQALHLLEDRSDGVRGLHSQSDIQRAKIYESQLSPASLRSVYRRERHGYS